MRMLLLLLLLYNINNRKVILIILVMVIVMVLLIMMVVIVVILAEDLPEQNRLAQLCRPAASAQGLGAKDYTPEITHVKIH